MSRPTAGWTLDVLVGSLARAGWGQLRDEVPGVRVVLRGLVDLLDHRSGRGFVTVPQLAEVTGLSVKWAAHCLRLLEGIGVITWARGWLQNGHPRPGYVTIPKAGIVALIEDARTGAARADRAEARREGLKDRLKKLAKATQRPRAKRNPLSRRPELSSSPTPLRGSNKARPAPVGAGAECIICHQTQIRCRQMDALAPSHDYRPRSGP